VKIATTKRQRKDFSINIKEQFTIKRSHLLAKFACLGLGKKLTQAVKSVGIGSVLLFSARLLTLALCRGESWVYR